MALGIAFLLLAFFFRGSNGEPLSTVPIDVQVSGGPSTILDVASAPVMAFYASTGIHAGFQCRMCMDSGCTCTISSVRSDFVTFRPKTTQIIVAKKGIILESHGEGDILLHTRDHLGYPVSLLIRNCLFVPDANRCLLSSVALGSDGYQTVLPAKEPHFPPGLYLPKDATGVQRYIPFHMDQDLCFIPTTDRGPEYSSFAPVTRRSQVENVSRKLGYMPMGALRECVRSGCIDGHGLSSTTKFPSDISPEARIGKARHIRFPSTTPAKWKRPMACVFFDTVGPTKCVSVQGYRFLTLFTDAYSGYTWPYGHTSTADIPDLFARFYADVAPLRESHGPILCVRTDNASVNVSRRFASQLTSLAIRHETDRKSTRLNSSHSSVSRMPSSA